MALIMIWAGKLNNMPGLIENLKSTESNLHADLIELRNKSLLVNKSICDLDDIIRTISSSTKIQEEKISTLDSFEKRSERFSEEVQRVDAIVSDLVNQLKHEFYNKYSYLKPEYESGLLENIWSDCTTFLKSAKEWCEEHWKLIATAALVGVSVILLSTGVGGILGAMALGTLCGAAIGGTVGGMLNAAGGGSFFEGFENGAFSGALSGMISGGMGFGMSSGGTVPLSLVKTLRIGFISGAGSSLISDVGDVCIKGKDISGAEAAVNALSSGVISSALCLFGFGMTKVMGSILNSNVFPKEAKELFRLGQTQNPNYGKVTSYTTANPKGVSLNLADSSGKSMFRMEFDMAHGMHFHLRSLFSTKAHIPLLPFLNSPISSGINSYLKTWKENVH